jgi:hypothetical protein
MKNTFKMIGIIAFVVVIGFTFPSCGDADSGGNVTNDKAVYTSIDGEGNVYELTITKNSDKTAYAPKAGDLFKLVITFAKDGIMKISEGTVTDEEVNGITTAFTLSVSSSSFSVSISTVTDDISVMTEITGTIPITSSDDDDTSPVIIEEVTLAPQVDNGSKAVIGVILNKTAIDLDVGGMETLLATVLPSNAVNKNVTWSSSNTSIASVSSSGTVTAMASGSAIITVTTSDGKKTATCAVTVKTPLTSATLASYLATLSKNTINTAYNVYLKVSRAEEFTTINAALNGMPNKYVNLDLTGSTVKEIPMQAFMIIIANPISIKGCDTLVGITIPDSVTSIGRFAFSDCINLISVNIPDSVTSIGNVAFNGCTSLASVTIGNGVKSIGDYAFFDCSSLTNITIPNNVISIGDSAFSSCDSLASVTIGSGVTSIGESAFDYCTNLASITLENGITSIGSYAFYQCIKLASVTIPSSVTNIGKNAFWNSNGILASVTFQGTIPSSGFYVGSSVLATFPGNLRDVFYSSNSTNGTPGTYITSNPGQYATWTKQ